MTKRMTVMLLTVALIFGGIFGFKYFQAKMQGAYFADFRPPPVTISAAYAEKVSWNLRLTSIGTLGARFGVDVSVEEEGIVRAIRFTSGQTVKAGDLLLELDDTVEQADLRSFESQLKLARLNYQRDKQLIEKRLTSQDQFDRSQAELEGAQARVEQTRANIAKKKVRAPFAGRMGILQVDPGQFLSSGTVIAPLQSLTTLHLDFNVPEQNLPALFVGQTASFTVDAYPEKVFSGEVFAIDSRVDANTRNISVRARVDNSEKLLIPGMFAAVNLVLEPPQALIVAPKTAINYSLYGEEVYVIEEKEGPGGVKALRVTRRTVKSGPRQGDQVAILENVEAGQLLVSDGQLKLYNGAEVSIANAEALQLPANRP